MIYVKREGVILESTSLEFENEGVMNPAVIAEGNVIHMFYRAVRKGNYSSIGYCRLEGPLKVVCRDNTPLLISKFDYESQGVEDPRIVKIEGLYYLTYTAYDGYSAMGALAVSSDLRNFDKKGIITSKITYPQFKELLRTQQAIISKYFRSSNKREATNEKGHPLYLMDKNVVFFSLLRSMGNFISCTASVLIYNT